GAAAEPIATMSRLTIDRGVVMNQLKRKMIVLLALLALALVLAACGGQEQEPAAEAPVAQPTEAMVEMEPTAMATEMMAEPTAAATEMMAQPTAEATEMMAQPTAEATEMAMTDADMAADP